MRDRTVIALLRGINVGGRNMIPMAELRSLCAGLGWAGTQTYIQSGNLIARAAGEPAALESELEQAILQHFRLAIPVIIRSAEAWSEYATSAPFPDAAAEPKLVMLALSKLPPHEDAVAELRRRAADGERVIRVGDALWVHFQGRVARSKLSPAVFDRVVGSPVTMRNWRTVQKLRELT
jgi:uncharacterized protein (DUF1697 family)